MVPLQSRTLRWSLGAGLVTALAVSPFASEAMRDGTASPDSIAWKTVVGLVERQWPSVPQMSSAELARRIAVGDTPLLIDTRTRDEYRVSHIPGAVWAESPVQLRTAIRDVPSDRLIVLYCSVGVRSSRAAAMLTRDGGFTIANLRGSIFQWANEGRALERDGTVATLVHPYNRAWGLLLDPRRRATTAQ